MTPLTPRAWVPVFIRRVREAVASPGGRCAGTVPGEESSCSPRSRWVAERSQCTGDACLLSGSPIARRSPAATPRTSAISKRRSNSRLLRPCSTWIRTFLVTPDSSASASWVRPCSMRSDRIRVPTCLRCAAQASRRTGSIWEGRAGTHQVRNSGAKMSALLVVL